MSISCRRLECVELHLHALYTPPLRNSLVFVLILFNDAILVVGVIHRRIRWEDDREY
jgi:hypothetical protein